MSSSRAHARAFMVSLHHPNLSTCLQEELQTLNANLQQNLAARDEFDAIIRETEGAYRKILDGSQALLDMVRRRAPRLPEDMLGGSP